MTVATGGEDEHGIGTIKSTWFGRPVVGVNRRLNPGNSSQALFQQQTPGAIFMLARSMAGRAGDEDDLFVGGQTGECAAREPQGKRGQGERSFHERFKVSTSGRDARAPISGAQSIAPRSV